MITASSLENAKFDEVKSTTVRRQQGIARTAARIFVTRIEDKIIKLLNITYDFFNSNTNLTNLDRLTAALFRVTNSQGFFGALNYLFVASNVAQTYGGIISGIALKDSKKKHEQDSISGAEVSDRLQSSVDELNNRLASATDLIAKLVYCRYVNTAAVRTNSKQKIRRLSKENICSRHLQELENYVFS